MSRRRKYTGENFVDGSLLRKAAEGQHSAIRELTGLAAAHLQDLASCHISGNDCLTPYVINALAAISNGSTPDEAFGWRQGRRGAPSREDGFRDFEIRMLVQSRMRSHGEPLTAACLATSSEGGGEVNLSNKRIEAICKGLTLDTEVQADDIFPLPKKRRPS